MSLVRMLLQDMLLACEVVRSMLLRVLQCTVLEFELVRSMFMVVLQSMPSPLEMCSCIAVVDGCETKNNFQIALAITSLLLAACDWHVPQFIRYHNLVCRLISAMCMQALFPYWPKISCLAILYPTFGKRAQMSSTSAPESGVGTSEHGSTWAGDKISLDDVIEKVKVAGKEDMRAGEILAAAITLRDFSGRD